MKPPQGGVIIIIYALRPKEFPMNSSKRKSYGYHPKSPIPGAVIRATQGDYASQIFLAENLLVRKDCRDFWQDKAKKNPNKPRL